MQCKNAKRLVTATDRVPALATLGDATEMESFQFYAAPPKVAKASTLSISVTGSIVLNYANENIATCKHFSLFCSITSSLVSLVYPSDKW